MKQTLTLFGLEADFFINADCPIKVVKITSLDKERSAVEITMEDEN